MLWLIAACDNPDCIAQARVEFHGCRSDGRPFIAPPPGWRDAAGSDALPWLQCVACAKGEGPAQRLVPQLRSESGATAVACRTALQDAGGDYRKALAALRDAGKA